MKLGKSIVTDGLVLHLDAANKKSYPGSGTTITDLSGNKNNGTLVNGVAFASDKAGNLNFDGTNDYITLATATSNAIYTVNFWYQMGANDGGYGYFTSAGGSPSKGLAISEGGTASVTGGTLAYGNFYYYDASAANKLTQTSLLTTGVWNNISAVIDTVGTNIKIYLNGSIIANQSLSNMDTSVSEIGRFSSHNTHYLNGNMASYKIYNRELTAAEVLQNFTAQRSRFTIPISHMIATGGTITTIGDYKIHTFNSSGTFEVTSFDNINGTIVDYLIVAGGGGGGYETAGGGGAGGLLQASGHLVSTSQYTVTIGAGGTGATAASNGANGGDSSVFSVTSDGGGVGGASSGTSVGKDGGSGGGGKRGSNAGGSATVGQGNDGGTGGPGSGTNTACAGGGGGSNNAGNAGATRGTGYGGDGGSGLQIDISGTNTYYAGGGGGGSYEVANTYFGRGGNGGGGRAASGTTLAVAGTANTGGGGGGGQLNNINDTPKFNGAAGGSGIIIIRYKFK